MKDEFLTIVQNQIIYFEKYTIIDWWYIDTLVNAYTFSSDFLEKRRYEIAKDMLVGAATGDMVQYEYPDEIEKECKSAIAYADKLIEMLSQKP